MENFNYVSESVLDYLPAKADLTEEMAISTDIQARRYVNIVPPNTVLLGITSTSMNNISQFKISSPSEWLDLMNCNLVATVKNIVVPSSAKVNDILLDGKYALINRVSCTVGGVEVNTSNNNFSVHRNAKYLNEAFVNNYMSDALVLNPGNAKLQNVLADPTVPTAKSFYTNIANCPQNFVSSAGAAAGSATAKGQDAYGLLTITDSAQPASFGYQNSMIMTSAVQTVTIPIGDLVPLFNIDKYFPLFLVGEVILTIYWNSPTLAFFSDACAVDGTGNWSALANLSSYDLDDIKLSCDFLTCSDTLNNSYKVRALSPEGLNLPYDDWFVQTSNPFSYFPNSKRLMQVNISTTSMKSLLFYVQGQIESQQNAWSNSHFPYLGISQFQCNINNMNVPPNPLTNATDIVLYNNRSRGVINNQLSQFVANNPYILGRAEGETTLANADTATCLTAFMIYNNFEKIINENPQLLKNGADLKSGTSTITIYWCDNSDGGAVAQSIVKGALGDVKGTYTAYACCEFQRLFSIQNGKVQVIG